MMSVIPRVTKASFHFFTTRKPEKTNGITDRIFPSVIIIPSQNLSVYTDGLDPSAKRLVYTDENIPSVYTNRFSDGVYSLSGNMQRRGDVRLFYRRNDRGIQTEIAVQ